MPADGNARGTRPSTAWAAASTGAPGLQRGNVGSMLAVDRQGKFADGGRIESIPAFMSSVGASGAASGITNI